MAETAEIPEKAEYRADYLLVTPSTLFVDNKSGINVAKNPEHHGRMKQLDLRFYWLREAVEEGIIDPVYVSTHEQLADILTKAVAKKVVEFVLDGKDLTTPGFEPGTYPCVLGSSNH